jgi:hypothetical protein
MASFVDSWEHKELLNISKQHRDAVDPNRVRADAVIGIDNWSTLKVSTVFAAIAIEAALNDYVLIHCLFLETPYLQDFFGDVTKNYLRASVQQKLKLVVDHWPDEFPTTLLQDVRELFRLRNWITHQTSVFLSVNETDDAKAVVQNRGLTNDEMQHMLRHYDIAYDFMSRFWLPGDRELNQPACKNSP